MKRAKAVVTLLMVSTMLLSMAGCGNSASNAGNAGASTGSDSSADGTDVSAAAGCLDLNIMIETPVESLDPQQAMDGTSFEVIADFTDGLMQMDADGQAVEAVAERYEVSEDGLTYTFHIREDAVWICEIYVTRTEGTVTDA